MLHLNACSWLLFTIWMDVIKYMYEYVSAIFISFFEEVLKDRQYTRKSTHQYPSLPAFSEIRSNRELRKRCNFSFRIFR